MRIFVSSLAALALTAGFAIAESRDLVRVHLSNAVQAAGTTIPAGGRMYVNHLYEFENDGCCTFFDGGIIEFSANGGAFADANSLFEAGHNYDGTLDAGNPFGARIAYTGTSFGYLGTKFNLSARAGQTIKFRFSIGSDQFAGALGWLLDDISIYQCVASAFTDDPLFGLVTKPKVAHLDELRQRINSIRIRRGLTGFAFADALLNNTIKVKAQHINEMRAALNAAYTAAGYVVPSYRDPVLNSGATIKASHFIDLRNAVLAIEAAP